MRVRRIPSVFIIALLALVSAACTSAPTQEMSDARQAINAARDAEAEAYAPRSLDSAERLLDNAQASLKAGDYNLARNDALEARQAAIKAREVAVAIVEARHAVEEAKVKGGAWEPAKDLLDEAKAAGQQGDEGRAWELATEVKRRLQ